MFSDSICIQKCCMDLHSAATYLYTHFIYYLYKYYHKNVLFVYFLNGSGNLYYCYYIAFYVILITWIFTPSNWEEKNVHCLYKMTSMFTFQIFRVVNKKLVTTDKYIAMGIVHVNASAEQLFASLKKFQQYR